MDDGCCGNAGIGNLEAVTERVSLQQSGHKIGDWFAQLQQFKSLQCFLDFTKLLLVAASGKQFELRHCADPHPGVGQTENELKARRLVATDINQDICVDQEISHVFDPSACVETL